MPGGVYSTRRFDSMDDIYRINVAKTELRQAYEAGDIEKLMSIFSSEGFTDMSEGGPSKYGAEAISRFRDAASKLLADYSVKLTPIIIKIAVLGDAAYDYGWHEFTLTPKSGGEPIRKRQRYFEVWNKETGGNWKISLHINNADVREELNGFASHWFLGDERAVAN
jgi:ketosteroid isomerase-like protein